VQLEVLFAIAVGAEDDIPAIRRIAALGVIAFGVGQPFQAAAVGVGLENIHMRVEIPRIAAPLAGPAFRLAPLIFLGVLLPGIGVEMAAGEDDLFAVRREVGTGGLADARADPAVSARVQIHDKDLVKRIPRLLLFGLEDDLFHVRREVALPGT